MGPPTGSRDDCEFPEVFHPDATSPRNGSVQWFVRADQGLGVPNGTAGDTMTNGGDGSFAFSVMEQSPEAHGDAMWSAVRWAGCRRSAGESQMIIEAARKWHMTRGFCECNDPR
jgi:hypothetical protein